jgi:hypothetical protein
MDDSPPEGSNISIKRLGSSRQITIPYKGGNILRYLIGLFLVFWLGGWVFGFKSAAYEVLSGRASEFLIVWLAGWSIGGFFAWYFAYRVFRPAVSEKIRLGIDSIFYDSGIPPFQLHFGFTKQKEIWRSIFPKRIKKEIRRDELKSLRLRETDTGNRLTVDSGVV